jgi:iron complex outermembrane receptor protein
VKPNHEYHNYSGTIGVSVPVSKIIRYNGNVGLATRAPGVNELYSNGLHHGAAAIEEGDPSLQVEKSIKTIHTLTLSSSDKWGLEVSGYYHYMSDFIYLKPQPDPRLTIRGAFPVYKYEQTDANIWGLDIGGRANIVGTLFWETSLSTVHGVDRSNDKYLISMPADRWKNALIYSFAQLGGLKDLEFKISGLQVWTQQRTPMNTVDPSEVFDSVVEYNYAVYEDFLPPPPGYFLLEFEAGFSLLSGTEKLKFHMAIRNLLNVSYRDYLNRLRYYADDTGRSLELRIKYQF